MGTYRKTVATLSQEVEVLRLNALSQDPIQIAKDLHLRQQTVDAIIARGVCSRTPVLSGVVRCHGCGARLTAIPCYGCEAQRYADATK